MTILSVTAVPAFFDNYIWVIERQNDNGVIVVDPGDSNPVIDWLSLHNKQLNAIVITHKHHDHIGGVADLVDSYSPKVYAPQGLSDVIADTFLSDGDTIQLLGFDWQVIAIPGHTLEHIMYYCAEAEIAFVGDTLFAGGCGRMFEGTAPQMYQSLCTITSLPKQTRLYPAHEYTLANLEFARRYDNNNEKLEARYKIVQTLRAHNSPSLPTNVAEELATNPFCRPQQLRKQLQKQTNEPLAEDWQVFGFLRRAKDNA